MQITVNGQKKEGLGSPLTVAGLLEHLGINPQSVVVERNLEIVARDHIAEVFIQDGDFLEIIRLVGGG